MDKQVFKVSATPRQRYSLARLLCRNTLKFRDRAKERSLYRARRSLGLMEPTEYILGNKPPSELWRDRTPAAFEVTLETADFVLATIGNIEIDSGESHMIEELLEQLEAVTTSKADASGTEDLAVLDIAAEEPLWKPSPMPILEGPELWWAVTKRVLSEAQSFGAYRKALLEELQTPEEKAEVEAAAAEAAKSSAAPPPS